MAQIDFDTLHDSLYNDNLQGKYNVSENEIVDESEDLFSEGGWCQDYDTKVIAALESVAGYDPRPHGIQRSESQKKFYNTRSGKWENLESVQLPAFQSESPPEELPAFMAVKWDPGYLGVDLRPHLADPSGLLLVDSGSQVSAWPPDPGDVPVHET